MSRSRTLKGPPLERRRSGYGRSLLLLAAAIIVGLAALFWTALAVFEDQELQAAENRLSLYRTTVVDAIERFQHLPPLLAQDPFVIAAAGGGQTEGLNRRLAGFAANANVEALYLMDPSGLTIAASNHAEPLTFLGQNYGFRPYFKAAMAGDRGQFFGIGATTSRPGYFIAEGVRGPDGTVLGVMALKVDLSPLAEAWAEANERVFVTNADGVVVLSSRPQWLYRALASIEPERLDAIIAQRQFGKEAPAGLQWQSDGANAAVLEGEEILLVTSVIDPLGWTLHFLADRGRVYERAWFTVIAVVILLLLIYALILFLRSRHLRAALETSQNARRRVAEAKRELEKEVEERRSTQARLEAAQQDLARSSKLAALGQLAASVTHELGQPISALRNHLAAWEIASTGGDKLDSATTLTRLSAIVARMEKATQQLRFFAQPGEETMTCFDLHEVVEGARDLMAFDLKSAGIGLTLELPSEPTLVSGDRLRLEQVLINLLRNARSAMEDTEGQMITVAIERGSESVSLIVMDRGEGLGDSSLAELQEPFHTTKASGKGMGLGLSISAAIVREHGGSLSARNRPGGGAVFAVTLPLATDQGQAA